MRWNLKEAGRKFPARRTEITYKAVHAGRACMTKRSPILHGAWNVNVAGVWDESGCAYPRRSRRLNTSIELRRVTKAHGDMSVGDEKSAEVIVPLRGRTESWQASVTAGCRKSSIGKSTQHRRHGGCRTASSAERKGRSERLSTNGRPKTKTPTPPRVVHCRETAVYRTVRTVV